MEYAIVNVPAAPVRRKPGHYREMVNQLLFGETVQILKTKGDLWVRVRSLHDNYEGWMTNTLLEETDKTAAETLSAFAAADLLNSIKVSDKTMHIPFGSSLPFFEMEKARPEEAIGRSHLGAMEYAFSGNYCKRNEQQPGPELVHQLAISWLNAPYLWGGRTPLGVDCSGFVQVIYKMMGIDLSRDAWQQAQEGRAVRKFKDALPGDLAFFDNKEDIVHVGILLGNDQIIHASGKVKIDPINRKGIVNAATGKRVLSLKAVRRVW